MRTHIIILLVQITSIVCLQAQHQGVYQSRSDTSMYVKISNTVIEINQITNDNLFENSVESYNLLTSSYTIENNKIIFFFTEGERKVLEMITTEKIILRDNIEYHLLSGTEFYCTMKVSTKGKVNYYGNWKDGLKDGFWLYLNDDNTQTKFLFKKDRIISRDSVQIIDGLF